MKKSLLLKSFFTLLALVFIATGLNAQLVLYEGFDYTIPGYIGGNGAAGTSSNNWTTHSVTTGQTTTVDLYSGNLSYTGLTTSVGNKILLFGNANATSRDINRAFTTSSTVIYFSALINIVDNSQITAAGDYFMHVAQTAGTPITVFGGRLGAKTVNSGTNYRFIIQNTSGGTPAFTEYPEDMVFGTTYLVVVKYDRSVSPTAATLWVNPLTLGGTEPTGFVSNNSGTGTFSAFASICLRNNATTPKAEIDEIRVGETYASVTPGADVTAPIPTFLPANSTADVAITVAPTITFNEPIYKTDGTAVVNADLASLVIFKQTDASGADVPFTAIINSTRKIITITPSAPLSNSQLYYLAISSIKDATGNQSTLANTLFTTIAAATPTVTLTYPAGGETVYAGDPVTFTWNSANVTTVNLEVWVPDNTTRVYAWVPIVTGATASAGKYDYTIPADAHYGTLYKIRLSDASNSSVNSTSGTFTMIASAISITDLKTNCIVDDIFRLNAEATISYIRTSATKQTYIQDSGAGIMIYDASAMITGVAAGDNIYGLKGKLSVYNGMFEILPVSSAFTIKSSGNLITPRTVTIADFNSSFSTYESMLVKFINVKFIDGNSTNTFAATATNYNVTDGTNTLIFRNFPSGEGDIAGSIIPNGHYNVTGLGLLYSSQPVVSSRTTSDFEFLTAVEKTSTADPVIFPVPAREVLTVRNINNIRFAEILDATGKVIRSLNISSDSEINIPVSDLKKGIYFLRLTTPTGKVTSKFIK